MCLVVNSYQAVVSPVPLLLFFGGPPTVSGFVVTFVVDSVDAVVEGRANAHVGEEVDEVEPMVAHDDTSRTVVRIFDEVRIIAPNDHHLPRIIRQRRGGIPLSVTMYRLGIAKFSLALF